MKCPLCPNSIERSEYMYDIYIPSTKDSTDITITKVCFTCFMLTSILQTLKEIKDGGSG